MHQSSHKSTGARSVLIMGQMEGVVFMDFTQGENWRGVLLGVDVGVQVRVPVK